MVMGTGLGGLSTWWYRGCIGDRESHVRTRGRYDLQHPFLSDLLSSSRLHLLKATLSFKQHHQLEDQVFRQVSLWGTLQIQTVAVHIKMEEFV